MNLLQKLFGDAAEVKMTKEEDALDTVDTLEEQFSKIFAEAKKTGKDMNYLGAELGVSVIGCGVYADGLKVVKANYAKMRGALETIRNGSGDDSAPDIATKVLESLNDEGTGG